jgi:hypothetical protein
MIGPQPRPKLPLPRVEQLRRLVDAQATHGAKFSHGSTFGNQTAHVARSLGVDPATLRRLLMKG